MTDVFSRARRPEQKQLRREHLLRTARHLLDEGMSLHDLGLNELARRAEVSKANVYRYFESREAVLLALLWEEATHAWDELAPTLRPGRRGTSTPEGIARTFARSFAAQPLLCSLASAVPSVLEANLSTEAIAAFKHQMLGFFDQAATAFEACCPDLTHAQYEALVYDAIMLMVGLYPMNHPAPAAARALEDPAFGFFRRDFGAELERCLVALATQYAAAPRRSR